MVWFSNIPPLVSWPLDSLLGYPLSFNFLFTLSYAVYYILLEPTLGLMAAPFLFTLSITANRFLVDGLSSGAVSTPIYNPNAIAFLIHASSWVFQFLGHGLAERRAPALFDNLLHAVVLAPFFVFCEVVASLGFKKELFSELEAITVKSIEKYKNGLKKAKEN
ncbi:hypothetical protein HDU76_012217 [Blyttiomyces sp. JEL0837]|nr:hypothetical protein HDU76_012217 [Blyttiomyces sp. JEL0837]